MNSRFLVLLALGVAAWCANLIGGWFITSRPSIRRVALNVFVSLGAGFMLAAAILEVVPLSYATNTLAGVYILGGYMFVHLVEHTISTHFHFGEETHCEAMLERRVAYSALGGLALHSFFDGTLIGAGYWVSPRFGILMFLAVVLHKIPEGFTAASIMRAAGRGLSAERFATLLVGCATLAGVLTIGMSQVLSRSALPFSAGVTLYVAASDLIPEVNKESGATVSVGVFLGVVVFLLTDFLLESML
jgi:zinc transporter ZupT